MTFGGSLETGNPGDPRMKGFETWTSVAELWRSIDAWIKPGGREEIALADAAGRVLGGRIVATVAVPPAEPILFESKRTPDTARMILCVIGTFVQRGPLFWSPHM
jgi:hypothetical protein